MKNKALDDIDRSLLELLTQDARSSYRTLAEHVGLSAPAVKERMNKLEDAGVITGYHAEVNPQQLGKPIGAFILVAVPYSQETTFIRFVKETPSIQRAHHIVGDSAFILQVRLESMKDLEALLKDCMRFGQTTTHMLLSRVK